MDKVIDGSVVVIVLVVVIPLMIWAWRRRRARAAVYGVVPTAPAQLGAVLAEGDALYLATTPEGSRYERIAARGLDYRARTHVTVSDAGIVMPIPGGDDIFIAAEKIDDVGRASWTVDRGIEPGGLVRVSWQLGGKPVESFFRFDDDDRDVLSAASALVAAR